LILEILRGKTIIVEKLEPVLRQRFLDDLRYFCIPIPKENFYLKNTYNIYSFELKWNVGEYKLRGKYFVAKRELPAGTILAIHDLNTGESGFLSIPDNFVRLGYSFHISSKDYLIVASRGNRPLFRRYNISDIMLCNMDFYIEGIFPTLDETDNTTELDQFNLPAAFKWSGDFIIYISDDNTSIKIYSIAELTKDINIYKPRYLGKIETFNYENGEKKISGFSKVSLKGNNLSISYEKEIHYYDLVDISNCRDQSEWPTPVVMRHQKGKELISIHGKLLHFFKGDDKQIIVNMKPHEKGQTKITLPRSRKVVFNDTYGDSDYFSHLQSEDYYDNLDHANIYQVNTPNSHHSCNVKKGLVASFPMTSISDTSIYLSTFFLLSAHYNLEEETTVIEYYPLCFCNFNCINLYSQTM
jgi:hypothetical protein